MRRAAALAGAAWAALLGGCALGPAHAPTPVRLDAQAVGLGAAATPALAARWWQVYGDPQLDELVARATAGNPSLGVALARLSEAQALAAEQGGRLGPQVAVSATINRQRYSARYVIPPPYGGATAWDGQVGLGLSWDPDFWGRQRNLVHADQSLVRAAELDVRAARLAIETAVVTAYLELDRLHALADLADQEVATRTDLAALARRRAGAGLDTAIDQQNAAAPVAESQQQIEELRSRIGQLVHQLAALSGQGAQAYDAIARPHLAEGAAPSVPQELPADLLLRRADLQAALQRVQAADAGAEAARLAYYPDLRLNAYAGTAALTLADLFSAPARQLSAGPSLHLPLFDAGQLRARHRQMRARLEGAIATYNGVVLEAVRQSADQLGRLRALDASEREARQRLDSLSEALRLVEERRAAGLVPQPAVLEAQTRVLAARGALISTGSYAAQARVALIAALGGGPADALAAPLTSTKATP